jgi:polyisoprenoid-binding protein YceI
MHSLGKISGLLMALSFLLPSGEVWAQWELDNGKSVVNFVSIKNDTVAEIHSFTSLVGYIGIDGKVQLGIDLDSVETLVPIRNERMRELLFDTAKFPAANISAQVDPVLLAAAVTGGVVSADLPVTLSLHGIELALTVPVVVVGEGVGEGDRRLRVLTARPVMVNAADFGLGAGVTALREIAGLKAISAAVPVTLQLVFIPAE